MGTVRVMSFPWHHEPWREVAEFVGPRVRADDRVLAPDQFWSVVTRVERYVPANLVLDATYDWVVLDMDVMPQIPRSFLEDVAARMTPVFVNRHFLVWSAEPPPQGDVVRHGDLARFWACLAKLGPEPSETNRCAEDLALANTPRITHLAEVDDTELRAAMNDLHRNTGYRYPTVRDQLHRDELRRHIEAAVARCDPGVALDVATGGERFVETPDHIRLVRCDLAEVGVGNSRRADGQSANITYSVVDAHRLAFPDTTFDLVLFTEAIEHVRDASAAFREIARVLRPGGELLVTFANSDSINQVLTEKLGYPRFVTNHQHFREFTLAEITEILADAGLGIVDTAGATFYPYWGVPGVDEIVREIIDDDPEFVAMMSELGRRVGAEYAYTGVVFARRPVR